MMFPRRLVLGTLLGMAPLLLVPTLRVQEAPPKPDAPNLWLYLAAVEGLHRDNVDPEVIAMLSRLGEDGTYLHFVKGCPVCIPVQQAILQHKGTPYLGQAKGEEPVRRALDPKLRARLLDDALAVRLKALEELVAHWVREDLARRNLSEATRNHYHHWMLDGRKLGMSQLQSMKASGLRKEWEGIGECGVCEGGAARAAALPVSAT